MSKTDETLKLENAIWSATQKLGVFGCFEVTIGFNGSERVDYMTMDTHGIFRCYEIKVSKSDFQSSAALSFVGDYNYYVLTGELYEQVKDEIPDWIGVYVGRSIKRKAKRRKDPVNRDELKDSLIRSLSREVQKTRKSENKDYMQRLIAKINLRDREHHKLNGFINGMEAAIINRYGFDALCEITREAREKEKKTNGG